MQQSRDERIGRIKIRVAKTQELTIKNWLISPEKWVMEVPSVGRKLWRVVISTVPNFVHEKQLDFTSKPNLLR
jgi:hypothetical protein